MGFSSVPNWGIVCSIGREEEERVCLCVTWECQACYCFIEAAHTQHPMPVPSNDIANITPMSFSSLLSYDPPNANNNNHLETIVNHMSSSACLPPPQPH